MVDSIYDELKISPIQERPNPFSCSFPPLHQWEKLTLGYEHFVTLTITVEQEARLPTRQLSPIFTLIGPTRLH